VFEAMASSAVITLVLKIANYTYGPLLGLFRVWHSDAPVGAWAVGAGGGGAGADAVRGSGEPGAGCGGKGIGWATNYW
jgi:hypothetical protein